MAQLDQTILKRNGIYRLFIDESQNDTLDNTDDVLYTVIGQSKMKSAPVNSMVKITDTTELYSTFGKRDPKMERNGCYFILWAEILLSQGRPIYMINVKEYTDAQTVEKIDLSVNVRESNAANTVEPSIRSIFDRSSGWLLDKNLLASENQDQLLTISTFREQNITVYVRPMKTTVFGQMTLKQYKERFTQLTIEDYIDDSIFVDDTFVEVYVFGRNFTSSSIATSAPLAPYMTSTGEVAIDELNGVDNLEALSLVRESNFLGKFTGSCMPEIIDESGASLFIETVINNSSKSTGLVSMVNLDAVYEYIDWDEDASGLRPLSIENDRFDLSNLIPTEIAETKVGSLTTTAGNFDTTANQKMVTTVLPKSTVNEHALELDIDDKISTHTGSTLKLSTSNDTVANEIEHTRVWELSTIAMDDKSILIHGALPKYIKVGMYSVANESSATENKYARIVSVAKLGQITLHDGSSADELVDLYKVTFDKDVRQLVVNVSNSTAEAFTYNDLLGTTVNVTANTLKHERIDIFYRPSDLNTTLKPFYLHGVTTTASQYVDNTFARQETILDYIESESISNAILDKEDNDFKYLVDSFKTFPIRESKKQLTRIADKAKRFIVLLSSPSWADFKNSNNPYFRDVDTGLVNPQYIVDGTNPNIVTTQEYTFPSKENGAALCGTFLQSFTCFDGTKSITIPSNALVALKYGEKIIDPNKNRYDICAGSDRNMGNIVYDNNGTTITGIEHKFTPNELDILEPNGFNTIILEGGEMLINGFSTGLIGENSSSASQISNVEFEIVVADEIHKILLKDVLFKENTADLRLSTKIKVNNLMNGLAVGTLESYSVQCDELNNTKATRDAGYFIIDVTMVTTNGIRIAVNRQILANSIS